MADPILYDRRPPSLRQRRNLIDPLMQRIRRQEFDKHQELLKDKYEQAQMVLRRKFKPVFLATVIGGSKKEYVCGYVQGTSEYNIIGRRDLLRLAKIVKKELGIK